MDAATNPWSAVEKWCCKKLTLDGDQGKSTTNHLPCCLWRWRQASHRPAHRTPTCGLGPMGSRTFTLVRGAIEPPKSGEGGEGVVKGLN